MGVAEFYAAIMLDWHRMRLKKSTELNTLMWTKKLDRYSRHFMGIPKSPPESTLAQHTFKLVLT